VGTRFGIGGGRTARLSYGERRALPLDTTAVLRAAAGEWGAGRFEPVEGGTIVDTMMNGRKSESECDCVGCSMAYL